MCWYKRSAVWCCVSLYRNMAFLIYDGHTEADRCACSTPYALSSAPLSFASPPAPHHPRTSPCPTNASRDPMQHKEHTCERRLRFNLPAPAQNMVAVMTRPVTQCLEGSRPATATCQRHLDLQWAVGHTCNDCPLLQRAVYRAIPRLGASLRGVFAPFLEKAKIRSGLLV